VKKAASKRENRAAAVAVINKPNPKDEFYTDERCWILEVWRDNAVTVARARVARGVTTKAHLLRGVVERYLIVEGRGIVTLGKGAPKEVGPGDVVTIPPKVSQSITNSGACDLIFYCICTPPFTQSCYKSLE
jgi:mannose-6-phosphate isomerase-like protein (cupin superfamily)